MHIDSIRSSFGWAIFRALGFVMIAIGFGLVLVPVIA